MGANESSPKSYLKFILKLYIRLPFNHTNQNSFDRQFPIVNMAAIVTCEICDFPFLSINSLRMLFVETFCTLTCLPNWNKWRLMYCDVVLEISIFPAIFFTMENSHSKQAFLSYEENKRINKSSKINLKNKKRYLFTCSLTYTLFICYNYYMTSQ